MAGAVVLDPDRLVSGIADSKLLSADERERLFDEIVQSALAWTVTRVDAAEIDRLNIHRASLQAMRDAVLALAPAPGFVLVDGFRIPGLAMPQRALIGGDRRSTAIAAASILAKVTRDRLMVSLHADDPRYGFDQHKGYATRQHLDAVARFGYSSLHRKTFRQPTLFDTIPS
jgi:ribonuclease HII